MKVIWCSCVTLFGLLLIQVGYFRANALPLDVLRANEDFDEDFEDNFDPDFIMPRQGLKSGSYPPWKGKTPPVSDYTDGDSNKYPRLKFPFDDSKEEIPSIEYSPIYDGESTSNRGNLFDRKIPFKVDPERPGTYASWERDGSTNPRIFDDRYDPVREDRFDPFIDDRFDPFRDDSRYPYDVSYPSLERDEWTPYPKTKIERVEMPEEVEIEPSPKQMAKALVAGLKTLCKLFGV